MRRLLVLITGLDGSRAVLDFSDDLRRRFATVERGAARLYRPPARLVAYDVALATTP
jgi:hypothetical protein